MPRWSNGTSPCGLTLDDFAMTHREIAERLGLSINRVWMIERSALRKLKNNPRSAELLNLAAKPRRSGGIGTLRQEETDNYDLLFDKQWQEWMGRKKRNGGQGVKSRKRR